MTLKSMTGFARADGSIGPARWHWEVRSVNGRGLDVRLRLPQGWEMLEPKVREAAAKRFSRVSNSVNLAMQRDAGNTEIRLNEEALAQVVRAAERVRQLTGAEPARVEGLLALKGVLEYVEPENGEAEALSAALIASLDRAFDGVEAARRAEGGKLAKVLGGLLDRIAGLAAEAEASPARGAEAIRARLKEQVGRLVDMPGGLDPARLHQEAVLLATRADIEEELKRLAAHVAGARELMSAGEAVGRKLDFLSQELNREANTLCAKTNDGDITRIGLSLKATIDQLREQVQNIE
jgi:uncharacterized protein (TIGR00255 family)